MHCLRVHARVGRACGTVCSGVCVSNKIIAIGLILRSLSSNHESKTTEGVYRACQGEKRPQLRREARIAPPRAAMRSASAINARQCACRPWTAGLGEAVGIRLAEGFAYIYICT